MSDNIEESSENFEELTEEDLLKMDRDFLENMDDKNLHHAHIDANDQSSFYFGVVFLIITVVGICFAVFWIVQGRRIRYRRTYKPQTYSYVPTTTINLVEI